MNLQLAQAQQAATSLSSSLHDKTTPSSAVGGDGGPSQHQQQQQQFIDYRFLVNRGDCHRSLGHIELALADYSAAHELRPTDWQVNINIEVKGI